MTYDLAIIGGGPAGIAAGVYAARKQLKTVFITKDFSNQSSVSDNIQNWIGTISISGTDLAANLEAHLRVVASPIVDIKTGEYVEKIAKDGPDFVITAGPNTYRAMTILITAGSSRRKLDVLGAAEFENKGLTYCASCDGPLFAGMDVAVVGGGNAGFETSAQLLAYCSSVTLLTHGVFKADPITVEKTLKDRKMKAMENVDLVKIEGDKFVTGLLYRAKKSKDEINLVVKGIFVEIGLIPNTGFVKDLVELDPWNHIIVDPKNQRASVSGIWAAGDCTDGFYHQNNIAAGDAVKALEDIYLHIYKMR